MKRNKDLDELRHWLGLSEETKRTPRVKRGASAELPIKRGRPKKVDHDALIDAFRAAEDEENQRLREHAAQAIRKTFTPGACYQVRRTKVKSFLSTARDDPEEGYAFIYLRKEGIHHIFQEAKNGWLRTYTDAQLVGKFVDEVRIQDVLIPAKGGFIYAR